MKKTASSKIARPSKAQTSEAVQKTPYELKQEHKKERNKILVIVFAVIMALSMMLPSLGQIFAGILNAGKESQQATITVDDIDKQYKDELAKVAETLKKNPEDSEAMLKEANLYYTWGLSLLQIGGESSKTSPIFEQAIGSFDNYLKVKPDDTKVAMTRDTCLFYSGKTDEAMDAMNKLAESSNYAPAWVSLATMYETEGKIDEAKQAYNKAIEADPKDEASAKSFAEQALKNLDENKADEKK